MRSPGTATPCSHLLAVDARAAIVATIYNFLPAVVVGVALHFLWGPVFGMAEFGFGVL